jgi:hypothetical protein
MGILPIGCTKPSLPWPEAKGALRGHSVHGAPTIFFLTRMSETNYGQHGNEGPAHHSVNHSYWRRAHHDWRFWAALVLMLVAITIYVLSDNLALLPRFSG